MTDALERLKNRNRPTVPIRDASLTPVTTVTPIHPISPDTSISRYQETEKPKTQDSKLPDIETLQTKQSTMRLEQGLSDRLQDLCRSHSISREVLIEAMFEYCESKPDVLDVVLAEAKQKNEHRLQVANLKRAKSMMEKFGQ